MNAPILREVTEELRTPRLVLRRPRAGDGLTVREAVVESLEALRAWPASLPWAMQEPTVEASEVFCRESAADFVKRTLLAYFAFERESDRFVASCSLHRIDWAVPKFEMGFWCRTSRHRRGYATEAVSCLAQYALGPLGARRVECVVDEENRACRGLCEKIGMRLEGVLRNERVTPDGQLRNTCIYAIAR